MLVGKGRLWKLVDARGRQVAQRGEPAACDPVALLQISNPAPNLYDIAKALVAGRRHRVHMAAMPGGGDIPGADAAHTALHLHLRSHYRCVLENERLVVFDLRPEGSTNLA